MAINNFPKLSNSVKSILYEGFIEVVGSENQIFNNSDLLVKEFDTSEFIDIYNNPEGFNYAKKLFLEEFGNLGSRGIAIRSGEASFRTFIRLYGNKTKLTNMEYRLMNSYQRCLFGLKQIAIFIKENCGMMINIFDLKNSWNIEIVKNEHFQYWNGLIGDFLLGLFREYFSWTSGGRFYVFETLPTSINGEQLFVLKINKQPLGN